MFMLIILGTLILYTFCTRLRLCPFFISKIVKDLFNGDKHDSAVFWQFAWMIPFSFIFHDKLAYVLICDQVSRHVERYLGRSSYLVNPKKLSWKAYQCIKNENFESYDIHTLMFFSLCIRHTTRDYPINSTVLSNIINVIENKNKNVLNINDHNRRTLRCYNTEKNQIDTMIHEPYVKDEELHMYVLQKLYEFIPENSHIVLMCSGGIDSMTLAHIFNEVVHVVPYTFSIFHIDWKKRLESTAECETLRRVFSTFDIIFESVEYPGEKNSPNWDNDTTMFRYQQMRRLQERHAPKKTYFVLGHVIEDLVENLLMNTLLDNSKGTNYLNIFGMKELNHIHDVNIFRPLLLHSKPTNTVPHFMDNAEDLLITRRAFRKQIGSFSVSRIRQLYYQAISLGDFFDKENFFNTPYRVYRKTPTIGLQRFYDSLGVRMSLKAIEHTKNMLKSKEKQGFPIHVQIGENDYHVLDENGRVVMFHRTQMY